MGKDTDKEKKQPAGYVVNDRRFWLRDDFDPSQIPDHPDLRKPSYVEDLESQLQEKTRTLGETLRAHKSSLADLDGARQRIERELTLRLEVEHARMVEPFLEVLDNLNRLLRACREEPANEANGSGRFASLLTGLDLSLKQLYEKLLKMGLQPIDCLGATFDPKTMEALITTPTEDVSQDGIVLEELRKGYRLGDRMVRPVGVRVGVAPRG